MAITVDWAAKIVFVPENEATISTVIGTDHYEYDLDLFRLELKALEASEEGMPFDDIHLHTTTFTIGNITLARVVAIINGYQIEFEDGTYQVDLNGANADIHLNRVVNQVSLNTGNTAGLVTTEGVIGQISSAVWETPQASHVAVATMGFVLNQITYQNKVWLDPLNTTGNATSGQVPGVNGTPTSPCLTVEDAKALADSLNISAYQILSATALDRDHARWEFEGSRDVLINPAGYDVSSAEFRGLCLAGNFSGHRINAHGAAIGDDVGSLAAMNINGDITESTINEIGLTLAAGTTILASCHSSAPGNARPTVDFQGIVNAKLSLRDYSGGIEPLNMSDATNIATMEFIAGKLTVQATCTGGSIAARGVGLCDDTNAGGTVIDGDSLISNPSVSETIHARSRYTKRDQIVYTNGMLTSARERWFPTRADAIAGTNATDTFTVTATPDLVETKQPLTFDKIRDV